MDLDQVELKRFLSYDAATGVFTRVASPSTRHTNRVGKASGSIHKRLGYVTVHVAGRNHYAHRLAWVFVHGSIPAGMQVDHANRDKTDNRLENLRLATQADNLRNCKVRADNTSGVKGVNFDKSRGKWSARVGRKLIGRFATLDEAAGARARAAAAAFGEFAAEA